MSNFISIHGGYKKLKSYQNSVIVYDLTDQFCNKYVSKFSRTRDQMVQAARSGKQNIVEGSQVSGTSKKSEIKLIGVARASLEELLEDYLDFLRQKKLKLWNKEDSRIQEIRKLSYRSNRSYETYMTYMSDPESAANSIICLIHQANYLLDRQLQSLEKDFLQNGGLAERMYAARKNIR